MTRWLVPVTGGCLLYLVMVGSVDPWAVAQGVLVAAAAGALAAGRGRRPGRPSRRAWRLALALPDLLGRQVVKGAWKVGLTAAGLRPVPRPAVVEVPLGAEPAVSPAALAVFETLSPGTYLLDLDEERRAMLFHVFDEADADDLRRRHRRLLRLEKAREREP